MSANVEAIHGIPGSITPHLLARPELEAVVTAAELHPAACANCGRPADLQVSIGPGLVCTERIERWAWLCAGCADQVEDDTEENGGA